MEMDILDNNGLSDKLSDAPGWLHQNNLCEFYSKFMKWCSHTVLNKIIYYIHDNHSSIYLTLHSNDSA